MKEPKEFAELVVLSALLGHSYGKWAGLLPITHRQSKNSQDEYKKGLEGLHRTLVWREGKPMSCPDHIFESIGKELQATLNQIARMEGFERPEYILDTNAFTTNGALVKNARDFMSLDAMKARTDYLMGITKYGAPIATSTCIQLTKLATFMDKLSDFSKNKPSMNREEGLSLG